MTKRWNVLIPVLATAVSLGVAAAQTAGEQAPASAPQERPAEAARPEQQRNPILVENPPQLRRTRPLLVPLPFEEALVLPPRPRGSVVPTETTVEEKYRYFLRSTFGARALANRAILTGINHWTDSPEEWSGQMDGFAQRMGSRMGRLMVRNAIMLAGDVALKTDSRYDQCDCSGLLARTGHAFKRVLVTRKDSGGETFGFARLAGAYVPPMITDQWYPPRLNTWEHKMKSGTTYLGWRAVTNVVREFWPEIGRALHLPEAFR